MIFSYCPNSYRK